MELQIIDGMLEARAVDVDRRSVDAVMSTDAVDRFYEVIEAKSWEKRLPRFRSSPVLLKDHDHTQPIGHWENVRVTDNGLAGTAVFASTDAARERFALHRDGHVKAFSVGFIPHAWSYKEVVHDGKKKKVRVFEDCELLECSSVAVPANPDALQRLIKGVGADPSIAPKDIDYTRLAKAIAQEGGLCEHVKEIIKQVLTDPVGPIDPFVREIVAAVRDDGSCGRHPEVPGSVKGNDDDTAKLDEISQTLRSLTGPKKTG